jgi:hypothetical protein
MLRITGFFPSVPSQLNFDLWFAPVGGQWRLFGLSVNFAQAPPAAEPHPQPPSPRAKAGQPAAEQPAPENPPAVKQAPRDALPSGGEAKPSKPK